MENATKALMIAGAVIIALVIISLGVILYQRGAEVVNSVNFSSQEITEFNSKFTAYQGRKVRGSEINAMLQTVLDSNMKSRAQGLAEGTFEAPGAKYVKVTGSVELNNTLTYIDPAKRANESKLYKVEVKMNGTTGLVEEIAVSEDNT